MDISLIECCCRQMFELTKAQFNEEKEYKQCKLDLEEREMLFKEARAGCNTAGAADGPNQF